MCANILRILWRDGHRESIDVETADALAERIAKLRDNAEVAEYRVYDATPKQVRTSAWETQP